MFGLVLGAGIFYTMSVTQNSIQDADQTVGGFSFTSTHLETLRWDGAGDGNWGDHRWLDEDSNALGAESS